MGISNVLPAAIGLTKITNRIEMNPPTHLPKSRKLYRGRKLPNIGFINPKADLLRWACTVKPGDYVATCEGFNRKVSRIVPVWQNSGYIKSDRYDRNWYLQEVEFYNERGGLHITGGGCVAPAESLEVIRSETLRVFKDYPEEDRTPRLIKMLKILEEGGTVWDEFGEILPEFDRMLQYK